MRPASEFAKEYLKWVLEQRAKQEKQGREKDHEAKSVAVYRLRIIDQMGVRRAERGPIPRRFWQQLVGCLPAMVRDFPERNFLNQQLENDHGFSVLSKNRRDH